MIRRVKSERNDHAEHAQELAADLKAKISVEAIKAQRGGNGTGQLYHVNPNLIAKWKKQALAALPEIFGQLHKGTVLQARPRTTNCSSRSATPRSNWSG